MLKPAVLSSFTKAAFGGQNLWSEIFLFALYFLHLDFDKNLPVLSPLHSSQGNQCQDMAWELVNHLFLRPNQIIANHHKPSSSFRSTLCTCSQWNKSRQNLGPIRSNSFCFNFLINQTRHKHRIQLQVIHKPRIVFLVEWQWEQAFQLKSASAYHLTVTALVRVQPGSCHYMAGWSGYIFQTEQFTHMYLPQSGEYTSKFESLEWVIPNFFPLKNGHLQFTFHGTSLSSTTAEDMLPILKMPVFLRKGGKKHTEYLLDWKIHHKGDFSSTAMLSFSCH